MYEQKLLTTKATKWIALAGSIISSIENAYEILSINNVYVDSIFYQYDEWVPGSKVVISVREHEGKIEDFKELLSIDESLAEIVLTSRASPNATYYWKTLYGRVLEIFFNNIVDYLKLKTIMTNSKRIEYMLIVSKRGEGVILQGDVNKVRIPKVKAWLIAHTHPSPYSFFSAKDIETTRDLFANQGLLSAVVTSISTCVLYRCGDMDVHDYENLIIVERKLAKGKIEDALKVMGKLKNVKLIVKGLPGL